MQITKRIEFDAGHRLSRHHGKCSAFHGHRYILEVTVEGSKDDKSGMVVDFGVLSGAIKDYIDTKWDHAFFISKFDPIKEHFLDLVKIMGETGSTLSNRVVITDGDPTAEQMAQEFVEKAWKDIRLKSFSEGEAKLVKVRLYETPNSFVEVTA